MSDASAIDSKSNQRSDSSTDRVLSILDLFTDEYPVWTTELLIEKLGVARATMYRYLRALVETGFLMPDGGGAYSLGPRFIEMDRQIRLVDPLLQVGPPVMQSLRPGFTGDQLLCRYYGLRLLSIFEDRVDPQIKVNTTFDRGRPFPLFLGAPSRIILANLTQQQLQRLFLNHPHEIAEAGLGRNWAEFRDKMREVSQLGYAVASDIDKQLVGISAPIFLPSGEVTASLCLVKMRKDVDDSEIKVIAALAVKAASEITNQLRKRMSSSKNSAQVPTNLKQNNQPRRPGRPPKATTSRTTIAKTAARKGR
ncbi:MAG: IclR family transcriptional regulator [Rhodoferax sp.]